jgi:hypothetical protein
MNNDANDLRMTLSMIIEHAIDIAPDGAFRDLIKNLTPAQIETMIADSPFAHDALRDALK